MLESDADARALPLLAMGGVGAVGEPLFLDVAASLARQRSYKRREQTAMENAKKLEGRLDFTVSGHDVVLHGDGGPDVLLGSTFSRPTADAEPAGSAEQLYALAHREIEGEIQLPGHLTAYRDGHSVEFRSTRVES